MSSSEPNQPAAEEKGPVAEAAGSDAPAVQADTPGVDDLELRVEVALMATDKPMQPTKLAEVAGPAVVKQVHAAVKALNKAYASSGRSFRIELVAGGYQVLTLPRFAEVAAAVQRKREQTRLGPAALETLAIIAYKQPIVRAEIEAIRGVACGEVLRALSERRLVTIVGRAEEIGRPMLYGTSKTFLEVFGLASLKDLPKVEEFQLFKA